MRMDVIDGRLGLFIQRSFLHVAHHSHDLSKWVFLVHPDADLLAERFLGWHMLAHKSFIHNEAMWRGFNIVRSRKVAPANEWDPHGAEVFRKHRAYDRSQPLARLRRGPSRDLEISPGCKAVKWQIADGAGRAHSRQLAKPVYRLLEEINFFQV